jgi:glycerophosphoryl diester phosphodiesterase
MKGTKKLIKPLVIAHRGASCQIDENTLESFKRAIELKADMIECDVQQTLDNVPIVIHDETLQRTLNGIGFVNNFTLSEIKALQTQQGFLVPTLEETLELIKDKIDIFIELKEVDPKSVLKILRNFKTTHQLLIGSFSCEALKNFKSFNTIGIVEDLDNLDSFLELNVSIIALESSLITLDVINFIKQRNCKIFAWTVDDEIIARKFFTLDIDGIITNNPERIRKCLHKID